MSDPFKEFAEEMARLTVPEDDTEESLGRREIAASESGTSIGELDESEIIATADDEFLCSERHLDAELLRAMGFSLADAFDLGRVQGIDFWPSLMLALLTHAAGEHERHQCHRQSRRWRRQTRPSASGFAPGVPPSSRARLLARARQRADTRVPDCLFAPRKAPRPKR
jgi:hypothetical protein